MAIDEKTQRRYAARAKIAKAMAHPSRLLMLDLLQQQELSVSQLTEHVGADQSTVSKHLNVLKEVGLVAIRKEGATHYYRVTCGCLDGFFSCMENVLRSDIQARQSALK